MGLFTVDGKPFFPLGGQSNNSSAYNEKELKSAVDGILAVGGNTLEAPVYWEQIEPSEDEFDFTSVDEMFRSCEQADIKLIILWFATWKNGEMRYVPEWVKKDALRFERAVSYFNSPMNVLSSHCEENLKADAKAFTKLIEHISKLDPKLETIIAVQVENEPGILGSDKDYGKRALDYYSGQVPVGLIEFIKGRAEGDAYKIWKESGAQSSGTWSEIFGIHGPEMGEAFSIARYINAVAKEGKKILSVPMSVNVWMGEHGWHIPGFYPAGGAVRRTIDIWKYATPDIDVIAPDIYLGNFTDYKKACETYTRDDNPLYIPESGANDQNALNMIRAIADFGCEGYFAFAIDSVLGPDGNLRPSARNFTYSLQATKNIAPLLLKYRGTGRIHSLVQEPYQQMKSFEFENFICAALFAGQGGLFVGKDHRYQQDPSLTEGLPHFGYIIEASPDEFYLSGHMHIYFAPKKSPDWNHVNKGVSPSYTPFDYLSVEEGVLDEQGNFSATRKRNGDEVVFGSFWASPQCGVVRVRLNI